MLKTLNLVKPKGILLANVCFKMESEVVSQAVSLYKEITKIPSVVSAYILPGISDKSLKVNSVWSAQDFVKVEKSLFSRNHVIEKSTRNILSTGISNDANSISLQTFSKSGKRQAILHEKKSPDETYLEIWNLTRKEMTFDMTERKEHGKIYGKDLFGCFKWSADEKFLLYSAEKKQPKGVSFFKETEKKDETEASGKGEEFVFKEEWGEGFSGLHRSILCILEIETGKIEVLPIDTLLETEISVGQAIWGPNDDSVVFVAWEELPYRLGIWACMNRRSSICSYNLKTKEIEFIRKDDNICSYSPCFSPSFEVLVFLENKSDGPHMKCSKLQKIEWKSKKLSTIVDIIENPVGDDFPGIYTLNLPARCWSSDEKHLIFNSLWRSKIATLCVNVENGRVKRIGKEDFGVSLVLDVQDNFLVAEASSPNTDPCLLLGHLNEEGAVDWTFLDEHAPHKHQDVKWNTIKLTPTDKNADFPDIDYEIVVISPAEVKKNNPLIITPHGGPHSCFPAGFAYSTLAFVKLGYIVCYINYRGSVGFGQNNVDSLPGHIGSQDVADVQDAAIYVKEKCNFDIGDVFIQGGSHGGFLGAHLCGQFPNFYKAAVLRNPVIDLSAMITISDIPDWCWVEGGCGSQIDLKSVVRPDNIKSMWEKSPIKHAEKVVAPTLLQLGTKDVRVPMSQGIQYYHLLKARNVPVRVFQYDDNHILCKTPVDGDKFIQTVLWFKNHSSTKNVI